MGEGRSAGLEPFGALLHEGAHRRLVGRDALVAEVRAALDAGRSVLLVGADGVGRSAVARAAARGRVDAGRGPVLDLRAWALDARPGRGRPGLDTLVEAAAAADAVVGVFHLGWLTAPPARADVPTAGERLLAAWHEGRVQLLLRASPSDLPRLARVPGLLETAVRIDVPPLDTPALREVLDEGAASLGLVVPPAARDALVDLAGRFLTHRAPPGATLELLARVADYHAQKAAIGEVEPISPDFVERVVAIYTGLPRSVVSGHHTLDPAEAEAELAKVLVGQPKAVAALAEVLGRFSRGEHAPSRPLASLLLVGPPGVGRSTVARLLAERALGSARRLVTVDLADDGPDGWRALLGDAEAPEAPTPVADHLRRHPYQVVLLEGLEHAPDAVTDALRAVHETGRLPLPDGDPVDLRACFLVATTAVGSAEIVERVERLGRPPQDAQARLGEAAADAFPVRRVGRFDRVVPMLPLDVDGARRIVRARLHAALHEAGADVPEALLELDDGAVDVVVRVGFSSRAGARGLERELRRRLVMPIATALVEGPLAPGERLVVGERDGHVRVRRVGPAARVDAVAGEATDVSPLDLKAAAHRAQADLAELSRQLDEAGLLEVRPTREPAGLISPAPERLDRLLARLAGLESDLDLATTPADRVALAARLAQLREHLGDARRELLFLGSEGAPGALVEVRPAPGGAHARDLVVRACLAWAQERGHRVTWLREPVEDDEPAHLAIRGPYAYGMLRGESGVHRRMVAGHVSEAVVRVGPWVGRAGPVAVLDERALKTSGLHGGKVRSRVVCDGGLVLQNDRTLVQNKELAFELARTWAQAPAAGEAVVRRYDLSAHRVHDGVLGEVAGSGDLAGEGALHGLLAARIDRQGEGPSAA